jgi:large conductance mechanosensitive channel
VGNRVETAAGALRRAGNLGAGAASTLLDEFRAFALKGNVVDLAIGVIVGAAFAKIVDCLVKNIIMPLVGLIMPSEQGYLGWKVTIGAKEIPYGLFIGDVVNFVIVALALFFFVVKFLG